MQPAHQHRIVHVGLPAIERHRLAAARDAHQLLRRPLRIIRQKRFVSEEILRPVCRTDQIQIEDVARLTVSRLEAKRRRQHEVREARHGSHRHFHRDPAAERRARKYGIAQIVVLGEIEIEVGEIVDLREALRSFGMAETRMPGRNHPIALRKLVQISGRIRVGSFRAMQEQHVRPLPAFQHFDFRAGHRQLFHA